VAAREGGAKRAAVRRAAGEMRPGSTLVIEGERFVEVTQQHWTSTMP
jgi:hypothetical protein